MITKKEARKDAYDEGYSHGYMDGYKKAELDYAKEMKTGEWITNLYAFGEDRYECNQCHNTALHLYDFCPNCGADMREVRE